MALFDNLKTVLTPYAEKINDHTVDIQDLNTAVDSLNGSLESIDTEIDSLNGSLEKLNNDLDVNISVNPGFEQGFWWGKSSSTTQQDYVRTQGGIPCAAGDVFTVDMSDYVGTEVQFNFYLQDAFVSRKTIRQAAYEDGKASATTPADVDNVRINVYSGGSTIYIDPTSYSTLQIFKNLHTSLKETLDNLFVDMPLPFEIGVIAISAGGWTYPNENTTKRVRTICGQSVRLYAGDIIKVSPNKSLRYFLGWRLTDGTYGSQNWKKVDHTITSDGDYVFSVAYDPDKDIADFGEIASGVYVRRGYGKYITDLQNQKAAIETVHNCLNFVRRNVKSINHRGWFTAPENTIEAFKQSKYYGFDCVETDIRATKDGVFVLLHDATINRTARNSDGTTIENTVNIADITLETALTYDFGAYKGAQYAGTKICTLEELLDFCKWMSVEPYLEVKNALTNEQIRQVVDTVSDYGMLKNVTFFGDAYVSDIISQYNHDVRVGIVLFSDVTQSAIDSVLSFRERGNSVFIDAQVELITAEGVALAKNAEVPLEAWNANASTFRNNPDPYISGFTTDNAIASAYTVWYKRYRFNGTG